MNISTSYIDMLSDLRAGNLKSPVVVDDNAYIKIRITGTGITERYEFDKDNNIIYENGKPKTYQIDRQKEVFLSDAFLKSCIGIPVLLQHPDDDILTSENFNKHVIGTIVDSYIYGSEVWGIARIYDKNILPMLKTELKSTSPCVISENKNSENGIVKEENPLIDHIAIVKDGYWDAYSNKAIHIDNFIRLEPNEEGKMEELEKKTSDEEVKKDNEELKQDDEKSENVETQKIEQIFAMVEDMYSKLLSNNEEKKEEKLKKDNDEEEAKQDDKLDIILKKIQDIIPLISASKDEEEKKEEVIEEKKEEDEETIEDVEEKNLLVDSVYKTSIKHKDNGFNYAKSIHTDSKYSYMDRILKKNASLVDDKYKFLLNGVNKGNYVIACDCLKSIENSLEIKSQSKKVDNKSSINVVYDDGNVKRYTGIFK